MLRRVITTVVALELCVSTLLVGSVAIAGELEPAEIGEVQVMADTSHSGDVQEEAVLEDELESSDSQDASQADPQQCLVKDSPEETSVIDEAELQDEVASLDLQSIPAGANLSDAMSAYGVSESMVYEAASAEEINNKLSTAGSVATSSSMAIVHVPTGTHTITKALSVPVNVMLVSEDAVVYQCNLSGTMSYVSGSIYGGVFDGAGKAAPAIRINERSYSGNNGIVKKVVVKNAAGHGILAAGAGCKGARIINSSVSNCGLNGINVHKDASVALISGCILDNNGYDAPSGCSGINLNHSSVTKIADCTITNNADKGISTNSDPSSGCKQEGCAIDTVSGCYFSGNVINCVYVKPKCHINHFVNNQLVKNKDGILCVSTTKAGTKGSCYIKDVRNNTFTNNESSQVHAYGSGAVIYLGGNNTITGGKNALLARQSGIVYINGANNTIQSSKGSGVDANKGKVFIKGTNTVIRKNGSMGIFANAGTVSISGAKTKIYGNKVSAIALYSKSKMTIAGASTSISKSKDSNIYVAEKSKLTIRGKGTIIQKAKQAGINANNATVMISGANTTIKANGKAGILAAAKSKVTITGKRAKVCSNGAQGIMCSKSTVTVSGASATIRGNKDAGIAAHESSKVTVKGSGCAITTNKKYGVYAAGGSRVVLKKTKISGNKKGTVKAEGSATITRK